MKGQSKLYPGGLFLCCEEGKKRRETWMGSWAITRYRNDGNVTAEMNVNGRSGSFTVLLGSYRNKEHYICIPDLDVGCPLSFDLQDIRWNSERLGRHMNRIDAITVASAVADFACKTGWERNGHPCPEPELRTRLSAYGPGDEKD